jgi:hypothetical protein
MILLVDRSDHEMIWLPDGDGDEISDREKHMIESPKLMPAFVWNPHAFQVVDAMPKGETFTATYYIRNILTEIVVRRGEKRESMLVMQADNARPHTATVRRAFCNGSFCELHHIHNIYPHVSPHLALSHISCVFFGHLRKRLQRQEFGSADELLSEVREILDEISADTLEAVFWEWIKRWERCIVANGNPWNKVTNGPLSDS